MPMQRLIYHAAANKSPLLATPVTNPICIERARSVLTRGEGGAAAAGILVTCRYGGRFFPPRFEKPILDKTTMKVLWLNFD